MLFDVTIAPAQVEVAGAEDHVQVGLGLGLPLPTGGGIMLLPAGAIRFALSKEDAIQYGKEIMEAGEALPDDKPQSDIVVAQSLAGVEEAVKNVEQFKGKQK